MLDDDLISVFGAIAETLFSSQLTPESTPSLSLPESAPESLLTARVEYSDGFRGVLSATLTERLARALTGRMMHRLPSECSEADVRDAIGEIANIAAGNLKGLLPTPCQVSLPRVQEGPPADERQHRLLAQARFRLFGEPLWAELRGTFGARPSKADE
jgi:chemotaxis protein CheY-P-specific phosphatase CheC